MATEKQISFYYSLCNLLGQKADEEFEIMPVLEASKAIAELKVMVQKYKEKYEGKDDACYWY